MRQTFSQNAREAGDAGTNHETTYARRNFLAHAVVGLQAAIGGTLALILGGSILTPSFARRRGTWVAAATVDELSDEGPVAVTIRMPRSDGYAQVVDRQVVFLVKTVDAGVTALSSVCTHLGCRVSWNAQGQELRCPCHGGLFDPRGAVKSGPPPAPLATLPAKVDGGRILVQI